jgi:hypothetical protein
MPNHITNHLVISGHPDHVQDVIEAVKTNDNPFDFEAFLPMPNELREVRSPVNIVSKAEYNKEMKEIERRKENPTDQDRFLGFTHSITKQMSKDYMERFGADNWYDWANQNWGTKWGCYDVEELGDGEYRFLTAWAGAYQAIHNLSTQFPFVEMTLKYADEDVGANTGIFKYKDGCIEQHTPECGSNEAYEIYFELCNPDHEGWKLVDGEWEYDEEYWD